MTDLWDFAEPNPSVFSTSLSTRKRTSVAASSADPVQAAAVGDAAPAAAEQREEETSACQQPWAACAQATLPQSQLMLHAHPLDATLATTLTHSATIHPAHRDIFYKDDSLEASFDSSSLDSGRSVNVRQPSHHRKPSIVPVLTTHTTLNVSPLPCTIAWAQEHPYAQSTSAESDQTSSARPFSATNLLPGRAASVATLGDMSEVCWAMPDGATGPAIIFQLTRRQRLGSLIVTNSGSNDSLRERGVQNFSVSISDDGATWTPIVNHATLPAARAPSATGRAQCTEQLDSLPSVTLQLNADAARFVRLDVESYYGVGAALRRFLICPPVRELSKREVYPLASVLDVDLNSLLSLRLWVCHLRQAMLQAICATGHGPDTALQPTDLAHSLYCRVLRRWYALAVEALRLAARAPLRAIIFAANGRALLTWATTLLRQEVGFQQSLDRSPQASPTKARRLPVVNGGHMTEDDVSVSDRPDASHSVVADASFAAQGRLRDLILAFEPVLRDSELAKQQVAWDFYGRRFSWPGLPLAASGSSPSLPLESSAADPAPVAPHSCCPHGKSSLVPVHCDTVVACSWCQGLLWAVQPALRCAAGGCAAVYHAVCVNNIDEYDSGSLLSQPRPTFGWLGISLQWSARHTSTPAGPLLPVLLTQLVHISLSTSAAALEQDVCCACGCLPAADKNLLYQLSTAPDTVVSPSLSLPQVLALLVEVLQQLPTPLVSAACLATLDQAYGQHVVMERHWRDMAAATVAEHLGSTEFSALRGVVLALSLLFIRLPAAARSAPVLDMLALTVGPSLTVATKLRQPAPRHFAHAKAVLMGYELLRALLSDQIHRIESVWREAHLLRAAADVLQVGDRQDGYSKSSWLLLRQALTGYTAGPVMPGIRQQLAHQEHADLLKATAQYMLTFELWQLQPYVPSMLVWRLEQHGAANGAVALPPLEPHALVDALLSQRDKDGEPSCVVSSANVANAGQEVVGAQASQSPRPLSSVPGPATPPCTSLRKKSFRQLLHSSSSSSGSSTNKAVAPTSSDAAEPALRLALAKRVTDMLLSARTARPDSSLPGTSTSAGQRPQADWEKLLDYQHRALLALHDELYKSCLVDETPVGAGSRLASAVSWLQASSVQHVRSMVALVNSPSSSAAPSPGSAQFGESPSCKTGRSPLRPINRKNSLRMALGRPEVIQENAELGPKVMPSSSALQAERTPSASLHQRRSARQAYRAKRFQMMAQMPEERETDLDLESERQDALNVTENLDQSLNQNEARADFSLSSTKSAALARPPLAEVPQAFFLQNLQAVRKASLRAALQVRHTARTLFDSDEVYL